MVRADHSTFQRLCAEHRRIEAVFGRIHALAPADLNAARNAFNALITTNRNRLLAFLLSL